MSVRTLIQWCYYTFGWFGCTKVSAGCKNCYMFALAKRYHQSRNVGPGAARVLPKYFQAASASMAEGKRKGAPFTWDRECAKKGIRRGVFPSLCDPFDAEVPIEWLASLLDFARVTTNLDWLLLTKRPENFRARVIAAGRHAHNSGNEALARWVYYWVEAIDPPANIWIGTSVEDQDNADRRIPALLAIPAKVRFLSCEPLLGPVKLPLRCLRDHNNDGDCDHHPAGCPQIHWVICGGESGHGARSCDVGHIRSLVQQCQAAGVPVFVKQLGKLPMVLGGVGATSDHPLVRLKLKEKKGGDMAEWPEDLRVRQLPEVRT
jgi:protein gp37